MILVPAVPAGVLAASMMIKPGQPADLAVDLSAFSGMPPRELAAMIRETTEIWRPYGVSLRWVMTAGETIGATQVITVVREPAAPVAAAPPRGRRLGAVTFVDGSVFAETSVALAVETIERLIDETPIATRRVADWPARLREEITGRALGRVLAHELGHYLIAWRGHTAEGLMRFQFRGDALVDPDRKPFRISETLLPRLNARLAQMHEAGDKHLTAGASGFSRR